MRIVGDSAIKINTHFAIPDKINHIIPIAKINNRNEKNPEFAFLHCAGIVTLLHEFRKYFAQAGERC